MGGQPIGADVDLHRAVGGTGNDDLADPFGRLDDVLHVVIGEHVQLARGAWPGDRQGHDRRRVEVVFLHDRRIESGRQATHDRGDRVANVLNPGVDIAVQLERHDHERLAVPGDRAELIDPRHGRHRIFDDRGDFRLDFAGRGTGHIGPHIHLCQVDVGKAVDAQLRERHQSRDHQRRDQHQCEDGAANTDFSEPVHVGLPGENSGKERGDADAAPPSGRP